MKRTERHGAGIDAGPLERGEEVLTVCLELLLGVPNLEHVNLVIAVRGMKAPACGLAESRSLEVADDALVIGLGHVLGGDMDRYSHRARNYRAVAPGGIIPIR